VSDHLVVVVSVEDFQYAEVDADGADGLFAMAGFQDDPDPMISPHAPAGHPPAAVHLQMRVDAGRSGSDEQVLAAAEYLVDPMPSEVDGGEPWYPDVAAR
jgi:hypothetical protein